MTDIVHQTLESETAPQIQKDRAQAAMKLYQEAVLLCEKFDLPFSCIRVEVWETGTPSKKHKKHPQNRFWLDPESGRFTEDTHPAPKVKHLSPFGSSWLDLGSDEEPHPAKRLYTYKAQGRRLSGVSEWLHPDGIELLAISARIGFQAFESTWHYKRFVRGNILPVPGKKGDVCDTCKADLSTHKKQGIWIQLQKMQCGPCYKEDIRKAKAAVAEARARVAEQQQALASRRYLPEMENIYSQLDRAELAADVPQDIAVPLGAFDVVFQSQAGDLRLSEEGDTAELWGRDGQILDIGLPLGSLVRFPLPTDIQGPLFIRYTGALSKTLMIHFRARREVVDNYRPLSNQGFNENWTSPPSGGSLATYTPPRRGPGRGIPPGAYTRRAVTPPQRGGSLLDDIAATWAGLSPQDTAGALLGVAFTRIFRPKKGGDR